MYFEQYGSRENPIIVFLHGAFFVHSFGRQYVLQDKYCLFVPHIIGYGKEADKTFQTEDAVKDLASFIENLGQKVTLIGFSLGAQLALKIITEHENLFHGAIIVSPWLIKDELSLSEAYRENGKQLKTLKNKTKCYIIAMMNGMPKAQRNEFVDQMQKVSLETLKNTVYNDISLETLEKFSKVKIPMLVLAGEKERREVKDSMTCLQKMNEQCKTEIWHKANHNIPPLFYKRFNEVIDKFMNQI